MGRQLGTTFILSHSKLLEITEAQVLIFPISFSFSLFFCHPCLCTNEVQKPLEFMWKFLLFFSVGLWRTIESLLNYEPVMMFHGKRLKKNIVLTLYFFPASVTNLAFFLCLNASLEKLTVWVSMNGVCFTKAETMSGHNLSTSDPPSNFSRPWRKHHH